MKISYNWLKDYVDIGLSPEKLAETLTMAGCAVESVRPLGRDHILEIEVTANRPDLLSVIGVAREVAALTGKKLKFQLSAFSHQLTAKEKSKTQKTKAENQIKVRVDDETLCPRYTARVIRGVKTGESPDWLKSRIEAMGLRPVNNIVDITNFCLFETGEPMHAFDLDKIKGEIAVRRAKKGERITAIDSGVKILEPSDLVIADSSGPIAIAGVMGSLDTEVGQFTKNILLEAASFDPASVRRSAKRTGFSTESSYRFERRVDAAAIQHASDRAAGLIVELAGGRAEEIVDIGEHRYAERHIELRFKRLNKVLGEKISPQRVKAILASLGLTTRASSGEKAKFKIPNFRPDLNQEIDLIEEAARVYGYDRIPATIPPVFEQPVRTSAGIEAARKIRLCLTGLGMDEIVTYSLLGEKTLAPAGGMDENIVEMLNPLTSEQAVMRPSLRAGMLGAILWNLNRKTKDLKLFELGNVYLKSPVGGFSERMRLSIGMTGRAQEGWMSGPRPCGFFDLKGALEAVLAELGIGSFSFRRAKCGYLSPAECAVVEAGDVDAGMLGLVEKRILDNFDIKDKVYILELDLEPVMKAARMEKHFEPLPKYPSVTRDISIVAASAVSVGDLAHSIRKAGAPVLKEARLVDRYTGRQIPDGKVGLTYRLEYRDPDRTLEDKDVSEVHSKILRALEEEFGAKLR